uniref:Uncharacterized protein n=2 Tax=Ixodes scapularis TaxID=6945 RepID=A0A1S4KYU1_IXOSC
TTSLAASKQRSEHSSMSELVSLSKSPESSDISSSPSSFSACQSIFSSSIEL